MQDCTATSAFNSISRTLTGSTAIGLLRWSKLSARPAHGRPATIHCHRAQRARLSRPGRFAKWIYTDWRGAYDIRNLATYVDLLCLMTYDQNTRWTMPGPVAGWDWTNENLDYALKTVPKAKLSLGIPLYGYHWYAGAPTHEPNSDVDKPNPTGDYIGYANAMQLATAYNGKVQWDEDDHSAYFWFYRDQMREWIFFTDLHTFKDRYELVQKSGIQGFCSWVLGEEDPEIWQFLPRHHSSTCEVVP
jgi:spore germination protein YaaH